MDIYDLSEESYNPGDGHADFAAQFYDPERGCLEALEASRKAAAEHYGARVGKNGKPQKRRGPKAGTKPALSRRQELNRQAQRTHRERKDNYVRNLENETLQFKELAMNARTDLESELDQYRKLVDVCLNHNIPVQALSLPQDDISLIVNADMAGQRISPQQMLNGDSIENEGVGQRGMDFDQLGLGFNQTYAGRGYISPGSAI